MEFGKYLSDSTKRKRVVAVSSAVLIVAIVCASVGLVADIAPLTVFSLVLLAGGLAVAGKLLVTVVVHLNGATGRLKALNDRYDDTERWLEQFDKGTRTTFINLSKVQGEIRGKADSIQENIVELRKELETYALREELSSYAARDDLSAYATREALDASIKSTSAESAKVQESVGKISKRVDQAAGDTKDLERKVREIQEASELLEASIESLGGELESKAKELSESIGNQAEEQRQHQQEVLRTAEAATKKQLATVDGSLSALQQTVNTSSALASRLRGDGYVRFTRLLSQDIVDRINSDIGTKLGLTVEQTQMRYLERKIQQIEAVCEGRLATTSEDAVARVLAARSCQTDSLKVLEIGVLFGIGTAFMHTALVPFFERVQLYLLDPFDGYYGSDNLDPLTGQVITRAAVERNMKRAAIDPKDVHFLEGFSTDDAILKKAKAAGPFDVLVIDGDHSYDGVKADYERYADLIVPEGILIVDDYGSDDWPEVTKYVDEILMKDDRFDQVGILSRTAIFRRNNSGGASKKKAAAKKPTAKSDSGSSAGGSKNSESTVSAKIAKKVAAKKASKKTTKKATSKASPTRKTSATKKQPKALADEIAGEAERVEAASDRA